MRPYFILLLSLIVIGCSTVNIKYNRDKILKKYSIDYSIYLDKRPVDLERYYLDKDNIDNIKVNRKNLEINITQFKPPVFLEFKSKNLDSLSRNIKGSSEDDIALIIINGVPLSDSLKYRTRVDTNAIQILEIIPYENIKNSIHHTNFEGDILVINSK